MILNYKLDIQNKSCSTVYTPSITSQRLPLYAYTCGHFYANREYFTEREGLDNYLLIYTIAGEGSLTYKGIDYALRANQAAVLYCYEPQFYKTVSDLPWEFKWVHFNGISANEFYDRINGDSFYVTGMGQNANISHLLSSIYQIVQSSDLLADIKICQALTDILSEIIVYKHSPLNNLKYQEHKNEVDRVTRFLQQNYEKKISINDISKMVSISKFHFVRLFKSYTGMSPYEYLLNYRINISKSLLKETDLNINEISCQVGFGDTNNYIRSFRKLTGTTPANYRKYMIH